MPSTVWLACERGLQPRLEFSLRSSFAFYLQRGAQQSGGGDRGGGGRSSSGGGGGGGGGGGNGGGNRRLSRRSPSATGARGRVAGY